MGQFSKHKLSNYNVLFKNSLFFYQATNGILHRARTNNFTICMQIQKSPAILIPTGDVSAVESKVRWCKEQYCIGTWNARSMNQGKLVVVKQEMARMNFKILGTSKVKWIRMGELNSEGHYIYYTEQEPLRRNGIVLIVNKGVQKAVPWCNL